MALVNVYCTQMVTGPSPETLLWSFVLVGNVGLQPVS